MNSLLIAYLSVNPYLYPSVRAQLRMISELYPDKCDRIIEGCETPYGILLLSKALGLPINERCCTRRLHDEKAIAHLKKLEVIK